MVGGVGAGPGRGAGPARLHRHRRPRHRPHQPAAEHLLQRGLPFDGVVFINSWGREESLNHSVRYRAVPFTSHSDHLEVSKNYKKMTKLLSCSDIKPKFRYVMRISSETSKRCIDLDF